MDESDEQLERGERPDAEALHELGNLLSAIRLSAEFALKNAAADELLKQDLRMIADAAKRGGDLVRSLQTTAIEDG